MSIRLIYSSFICSLLAIIPVHAELMTVGENYAVFFEHQKNGSTKPIRIDNLIPNHAYKMHGAYFKTLARPSGKLLTTFVTVSDTHIGETICGFDSKHPKRHPFFFNEPGKTPYAEMMSQEAVKEIKEINPDTVLVKGDVTDAGEPKDIQKFEQIWGVFGDKLHWVMGNHDVHSGRQVDAPLMVRVDLPGTTLALLDTSIDRKVSGQLREEQLAWLTKIAESTKNRILIFGHHPIWIPGTKRSADYFGIKPEDSEKLIAIVRQHKNIVGYFAAHTHANRLKYVPGLCGVPFAQVGAVKEFPGAWAEYRVFEGGIEEITHRVASPEALAWTEKTRKMDSGTYDKVHFGKITDRCFTIYPRQ